MKQLVLALALVAAACGGNKGKPPNKPMGGSGSAMPDNKMQGSGDKKPDDGPTGADPCAVPPP